MVTQSQLTTLIVIFFGKADDVENFAKDCVAKWWPLAMFHSMSKAKFSRSDIAISVPFV